MSEHVEPELAMALMAFATDDPERRAIERHAEGCPACRALLDEGRLMLGWVDSCATVPRVDPALKARIRAAVLTPQPSQTSARARWALALGMLVSTVLALLDGAPGELSPALGLRCLAYENLVAVAPFAVAVLLGMRGVVRMAPMNLAVVSMAGAIGGQVLLHFRCETRATPHLFAFHVVGVALAAAIGYAATHGIARLRGEGAR